MKFSALLIIPILFTGCMKQSLSSSELKELLNGVNPGKLDSLHYKFEGNHGGYSFVARVQAPSTVIDKITEGSTASVHEDTSDALFTAEVRKNSFQRLLGYSRPLPDWLDIPWDSPLVESHSEGSNSFTSQFDRSFFYDSKRDILYIAEGGN